MIPVWVWDNRRKTYVTLPAPVQQFKSGNWGWTKEQYYDNQKIEDFALTHSHLLWTSYLMKGLRAPLQGYSLGGA